MELYIADAFTAQRFCGNQAGVALLEPGEGFPDSAFMAALAGELKHSETAFVRQLPSGVCQIRYFTPAGEVDLCGHATVAAFTVLRETGRLLPGRYGLETRAGSLSILLGEDRVWMDMARPREWRIFSGEERKALYDACRLSEEDAPEDLEPALVSTGLADIMLPVRDRAALSRMAQDREAVKALSRRYDCAGFHVFCVDREYTACCRNLAPLYDIDEEAATGTANGSLTYYLFRRGRITAGAENCFLQGEDMGKPSLVRSRLMAEAGEVNIQIGGGAVLTLHCKLL